MMILWFFRFFVFHLHESPKYLMGRGQDQEAVDVVHKIARYNRVHSSLSVEELKSSEGVHGTADKADAAVVEEETLGGNRVGKVVRQHLSKFDSNHVYPLFATRKLAYSTTLLIILWGEWRGLDYKKKKNVLD